MSQATSLPADLLAALRAYDTPTVCNALEIVAPERRAVGFTVEPLVTARPNLPPIVGYARTAAIRARQPTTLDREAIKALRLSYYEYIASGPKPAIAVIQDLDRPTQGYGAFWGEVQSNVHKGLGCLGGITDGSIRDLDMLAPGFQLLAGRIGPSHAHVHLVAHGQAVNVAGMLVSSGDLVHADRHGAVVIPASVAAKLPDACALLGRREAVILEAAKRPDFSFAVLARALAAAEEIH
jgi:regulator of RNase E activity RraA